jgi:hypothetical protein
MERILQFVILLEFLFRHAVLVKREVAMLNRHRLSLQISPAQFFGG